MARLPRGAAAPGIKPHFADILAIQAGEDPDDPAHETHVYLTDYQSLYVAHLGEITEEDPSRAEPDRVPEYYRKEGLALRFLAPALGHPTAGLG